MDLTVLHDLLFKATTDPQALDVLNSKAKEFRESDRRRDRQGRWTAGGPTTGYAWDKEKKSWVDEKGKPLPKAIRDRLEKLMKTSDMSRNLIGVKLNPSKTKELQAVGWFYNEQEGKLASKKYVYLDSYKTKQDAKKFSSLKKFDKVKTKIARASYKDAMNGKPAAAVVYLMDQTAIRVGSGAKGGRTASGIGACDLRIRHVKVRGNKVTLSFKGKSGVAFKNSYTSAKLASVVKSFMEEGDKGRNDLLFGVTDDTVRTYLRSKAGKDAKELKNHHYRYWHGTNIATQIIEKRVKNRKNLKKADVLKIKKEVCENVAAFLNNTPAVCFNHYIDPAVWKFIPTDVKFAMPRGGKAAPDGFDTTPAMEDLFDETIYPEAEGSIDDLFADQNEDDDIEETEEDSEAYEEFLQDDEGYPE